jgi:hypothetical protein
MRKIALVVGIAVCCATLAIVASLTLGGTVSAQGITSYAVIMACKPDNYASPPVPPTVFMVSKSPGVPEIPNGTDCATAIAELWNHQLTIVDLREINIGGAEGVIQYTFGRNTGMTGMCCGH